MNSSIEEFDKQIASEMSFRHYLKASHSLTKMIESFNANNCQLNPTLNNIKCYKYYLMRSYCYQQLSTEESLHMAYDDVLSAIRLDKNQFQSYLQGLYNLFPFVFNYFFLFSN